MAEPRLMRTALAAASSATEGAPGQTITATGSGPAVSSAIAAGSTRPGTNKLSAPAAAYTADRSRASSIRRVPARNTSVRALIQNGMPRAAARAAASRSACSAGA
jgi:hypothetical protein